MEGCAGVSLFENLANITFVGIVLTKGLIVLLLPLFAASDFDFQLTNEKTTRNAE